jgi:hypothetical protein
MTNRCRAKNPAACTDPNCPDKKAFLADFSTDAAKRKRRPYILYRESMFETGKEVAELTSIESIFAQQAGTELDKVPDEVSVVFPRYRTLPYGDLLDEEVRSRGNVLANSWEQYNYISNLFAWAKDLEGLTPPAYTEADIPNLPEGAYFIKGETNSEKHDWVNSAYAPDLAGVQRVVANLKNHPLIGSQKLVIRPFINYRQLAVQPNGQPVFNEWRVFTLGGEVMADGFYWSQQTDRFPAGANKPLDQSQYDATINLALERIKGKAEFVVIDVAEKPDGSWDVIELNDGNMSGLTSVDPDVLWSNIHAYYEAD